MRTFTPSLIVAIAGVGALIASRQSPTFRGATDLVVADVNVTDRQGRFVTGLPTSAFTVLEDGRPQSIQVLTRDDAPAAIGLVVDASASVWPIRPRLMEAARAFAAATRPGDRLFALAFNDVVVPVLPPDMAFTDDGDLLSRLLDRAVLAIGRTALFDAIDQGLDHLATSDRPRRVLVVISDGSDNASHATRDDTLRRVQSSNVVIYAVALRDPDTGTSNPKVLRALAETSGGLTIPTDSDRTMVPALRAVAANIREAYTVAYAPDRPPDGTLRQIRVIVTPPNGDRLLVRARMTWRAQGVPAAPQAPTP